MNTPKLSSSPTSLRARINTTIHSFSLTGGIIFYILLTAFILSALSMLWQINEHYMIEVPGKGGTITEGVIGVPRYINPVLAVTDGDKDITALVYSGLMRETPDGDIVPDLAESYTLSEDGKTYTFIINPKAVFQDGAPVTADDVLYTINRVQTTSVKSPKHANWTGVVAQKIDNKTVSFTLDHAYAPFLENTTLGILPQHSWKETTDDTFALNSLNISPIGSGPYKIKSVIKDGDGVPSGYILSSNGKYISGEPKISTIAFKFFQTEKDLTDAYTQGKIDSVNSISPDSAMALKKRGATVYTSELPRVFGVFFNQTESDALGYKEVRSALDMSVNRDYIVNTVLQGFGTPITGPVPPSFVDDSPSHTSSAQKTVSASTDPIADANKLLDKNGWSLNSEGVREKKTATGTTTLEFSISTSDAPELKEVADILKEEWQKVGAKVTVKVFEGGYLNQNIIRPRKYDALLFGQIVNKDLDLYAFWHSSQKSDPGLNVAMYANPKADKILESLRTLPDPLSRQNQYLDLQALIQADHPAVFLYAPHLIYITSPKVHSMAIGKLTTPSERFNGISSWYINIDRVWKIFAQK